MKLLDLFCGAGGAAMGYYCAGFDEIVGVDIHPMPRYPFTFIRGDALAYVREHGREFDAIHASPPCQAYANVTRWTGVQANHPRLIAATRDTLDKIGVPYVIENVRTSEINPFIMLCGSMFGLRVQRHRYFESPNIAACLVQACCHVGLMPFVHKHERKYADEMGCTWMNKYEARQAIPPAYTEFIGRHLLEYIEAQHESERSE